MKARWAPIATANNATRRTILAGADGVVFVADSQPEREEANLVAHASYLENLERAGLSPERIGVVYQWNKRDLPRTLPTRTLARQLNIGTTPAIEACASRGDGVRETERLVLGRAIAHLKEQLAAEATV